MSQTNKRNDCIFASTNGWYVVGDIEMNTLQLSSIYMLNVVDKCICEFIKIKQGNLIRTSLALFALLSSTRDKSTLIRCYHIIIGINYTRERECEGVSKLGVGRFVVRKFYKHLKFISISIRIDGAANISRKQ